MDVIFATRSGTQNRYSIKGIEGYGRVLFNKGVLVTTDKKLIETLLNHPNKRKGDFTLVTNEELVAKYLDDEAPDVLTKEILNNIKREGILELGQILQAETSQPTLIKAEIVGRPITNAVQEILSFYEIKPEVKEEAEVAKETRTASKTKTVGRPKKETK